MGPEATPEARHLRNLTSCEKGKKYETDVHKDLGDVADGAWPDLDAGLGPAR
jgi:hypothetical protein